MKINAGLFIEDLVIAIIVLSWFCCLFVNKLMNNYCYQPTNSPEKLDQLCYSALSASLFSDHNGLGLDEVCLCVCHFKMHRAEVMKLLKMNARLYQN